MTSWSIFQETLLYLLLPGFLTTFCISIVVPRRVVIACAILAGVCLAVYLNRGLLPWWPDSLGWEALLPVLLLVIILVNLLTIAKTNPIRGWFLRGLVAGAIASLLLSNSEERWEYRVGLGLACLLSQLVLESTHHRASSGVVALWIGMTSLAASVVFFLIPAGKLCDVSLILAAAWFGLALTGHWKKADLRVAFATYSLALPCLLLASRLYQESNLTLVSITLIALSPVSALLMLLPPRWCPSSILRHAMMSALWLSFLVIAVGLAIIPQAKPVP